MTIRKTTKKRAPAKKRTTGTVEPRAAEADARAADLEATTRSSVARAREMIDEMRTRDRLAAFDKKKITVLVGENPKRPGSASARRFERYRNGMTVAEALAAGLRRDDLRWDTAHDFIKIA